MRAKGQIVTLDVILKREERRIDELNQTLILADQRRKTLQRIIERETKSATKALRVQLAAVEKTVTKLYAGEMTALTKQVTQITAALDDITHLSEFQDEVSDSFSRSITRIAGQTVTAEPQVNAHEPDEARSKSICSSTPQTSKSKI